MELQRIGIKLFADSPAPVPVRDFIPVFHSWIQKQAIDRHLLIDVHNYSHIHNGPGILLVAQEGNFSIDMADGRMGLLYYRKKSGNDVASVLKTALAACRLLDYGEEELRAFGRDDIVDPGRPVEHRVLGVEMQMDE
jgi:hypothetical protein